MKVHEPDLLGDFLEYPPLVRRTRDSIDLAPPRPDATLAAAIASNIHIDVLSS
jgi:hypothetical protein